MNDTVINIFISHSWNYSGHYETLYSWIFDGRWYVDQSHQRRDLRFLDYSVPKDDPIHNARNEQDLLRRIQAQIHASHVVVIPMGMYASHSKWIQKEIVSSRKLNKPILAVDPWGQERSASIVKNNAAADVGWQKKSVVGGVWQLFERFYL